MTDSHGPASDTAADTAGSGDSADSSTPPAARESATSAASAGSAAGDAGRRRLLRYGVPAAVVAGALVLTLVSILDGDDPVKVKLPKPPADARARIDEVCDDLSAQLPSEVLGHKARKTVPDSDLTAAWGNPAIVLRCGVPKPVSLRPEDPNYDPAQNALGANGVYWTYEFLGKDKGVRLTTLQREVNVELLVPPGYAEPGGVTTAFADAIKKTVPSTMGDIQP